MLSANRGTFYFFLSKVDDSDFTSWPNYPARATCTMFNKYGAHGHPRFILDLRGRAFSLSPLGMMLVVDFATNGLCPFTGVPYHS